MGFLNDAVTWYINLYVNTVLISLYNGMWSYFRIFVQYGLGVCSSEIGQEYTVLWLYALFDVHATYA